MLRQIIKIDKTFIKFINTCFGKADFETQHNQCDFGEYPLNEVIEAYHKFTSFEWVFDYNCSDCSFPKFKNIQTQKTEACSCCGD